MLYICSENFTVMIHNVMLLGIIGQWEIVLIVLVIVLIFFGGKKIPELMKGLGRGVRSFKEGMSGEEEKKDDDKINDLTKKN
jgi:sec-independent protein translocase protein TatA